MYRKLNREFVRSLHAEIREETFLERSKPMKLGAASDEVNPAGVYVVRLCHAGIWKEVMIDDLFPTSKVFHGRARNPSAVDYHRL